MDYNSWNPKIALIVIIPNSLPLFAYTFPDSHFSQCSFNLTHSLCHVAYLIPFFSFKISLSHLISFVLSVFGVWKKRKSFVLPSKRLSRGISVTKKVKLLTFYFIFTPTQLLIRVHQLSNSNESVSGLKAFLTQQFDLLSTVAGKRKTMEKVADMINQGFLCFFN